MAAMSEQEKQQTISELRLKSDSLKDEIMSSSNECQEMEDEFRVMQGSVAKMVTLFKQAKFELAVAHDMNYDENTAFNENNVIQYLAQLEEYISSLITHMAFKRDDPNAAISSVPLEKLNQKEFNKREIQIDAPVDTERDTSTIMGARTDAGDERRDAPRHVRGHCARRSVHHRNVHPARRHARSVRGN